MKQDPFDFDTPVDRRGTASLKWDRYQSRDILPLWLADMDFKSPPAVIDALQQRVAHGIFGYTVPPRELVDVIVSMLRETYHWSIDRLWLVWLPGLVTGLNLACRAVGAPGDGVLTAVPVYPPFLTAPNHAKRSLVTVPLVEKGTRWTMAVEQLERAVTSRTRLFLLCNPHNPVGTVFTKAELSDLITICRRHDIIVCSDEIHCGLILDRTRKHHPLATISPDFAHRTITLMAPSKTFNLPGLGCSFAVIPDPSLRKRFQEAMGGIVPHVNTLGYTAALAAYRDGASWYAGLLNYLGQNLDVVQEAVDRIPGLSMRRPEATYLAWIRVSAAGIKRPAHFFENAGVGLSDGSEFGDPGHVRLNFGCPRNRLKNALRRMSLAMNDHLGERG